MIVSVLWLFTIKCLTCCSHSTLCSSTNYCLVLAHNIHENAWRLGLSVCHLWDVIVELLQGLLAVAERVSGALPQLHQDTFVHCEQLEARVEPLDMLAEDHLKTPDTWSAHVMANDWTQCVTCYTECNTRAKSHCRDGSNWIDEPPNQTQFLPWDKIQFKTNFI